MNKMKKLLAILVAFVMCFTVFGMVASADEFNPTVYLKTNFDDNEATTVTANISTSQACGAIQGTLKFTGASYVENSAKFIEDGATADKLVINGNEIKFVVVTDELAKGDTNWASFKFQITKADADVTFDLTDVSVCDIAATTLKDSNSISIPQEKIEITAPIRPLGGQYRAQSGDIKAALRFGSDLKLNMSTSKVTIDGTEYEAISCGHILGFDFIIKSKNEGTKAGLSTYPTFNSETGTLTSDTTKNGVKVYEAKRYLVKKGTSIIYTLAIVPTYYGAENTPTVVDGHKLIDEKISAVPYVIYKDGDKYEVKYGTEISRSYSEILENYQLNNSSNS